jgi:acetyl esterase
MTAAATTGVGRLDRRTQEFVDALVEQGGKPIYQLSIADARAVLDGLQAQAVDMLAAVEEDMSIPGGPNGEVSVRIIRPRAATGTLPAVMYYHGGGWILGNKNTHDRLIREIANGANAVVVFVNYTPSPEAQYPTSIEEAYAAAQYVAENGDDMNIDSSRLAVVGDSVGGNMTAAVTILAKQRGGPKITHQVLLYPVTDSGFDTASYEQFADGPWLTKAAMKWFWDAYAPDPEIRKQITASPLQASVEELAGLPPALIVTDENDVLRDEGEAYAHKLMAAGVDVAAVRCLGTIHDFMMLNALARTPAVRSAISLTNDTLRRALSADQQTRERSHI